MSRELEALRREALVANPLVGGQPILFVVRHQYRSHYHAIDTLFHTGELNADRGMTPHADLFQGGGALKTIDLATGRVQTLVETSPTASCRDPEVHFDGQRIVFAMRRNRDEDYHIWEIAGRRHGPEAAHRRRRACPTSIPSTCPTSGSPSPRRGSRSTTSAAATTGRTCSAWNADGANIHQIGKNNLFDNHGTLTPDGRILYARWEYVDRNFGDAHGALDGQSRRHEPGDLLGQQHRLARRGLLSPRRSPARSRCCASSGMHHFRLWGALAIVDRRAGLGRPRRGVIRTWPADAIERVRAGGGFDCDGFVSVYPKYECPYPLSDKYFLCSRMTMRPGQLPGRATRSAATRWGSTWSTCSATRLLLHAEAPGCYDPHAAGARGPVRRSSRRGATSRTGEGYFYVADVYRGTHMAGVPRGAVKSLRVVESPEKRHWSPGAWFGQGYTAPGMNWHSLENKRILGTRAGRGGRLGVLRRALGDVRLLPAARRTTG